MLEPIKHALSQQRIILCSKSPRRKDLLKQIGLTFGVVSSNFKEDLNKDDFSHPSEYVKENAKKKAIDGWEQFTDKENKPDLIIAADTVVTMGFHIYEKPRNDDNAFYMLSKLSGKKHTVFTGVALLTKSSSTTPQSNDNFKVTTFHEATDVFMREMSPEIIKSYIATREPIDKAGSYAIQGIGSTLIEGIKGDYFNVLGLPLSSLAKELYHIYTD